MKPAPISSTKSAPLNNSAQKSDYVDAGLDSENKSSERAMNAAAKTEAASTKPAASKKRKSGHQTTLAEDIAAYKQDLDHIDIGDPHVDMSCLQVRNRINQVLDGAIMNKGEFCKAIGSSSRSLNTFLQKCGNDGINTDSYVQRLGLVQAA